MSNPEDNYLSEFVWGDSPPSCCYKVVDRAVDKVVDKTVDRAVDKAVEPDCRHRAEKGLRVVEGEGESELGYFRAGAP